MHCWNYSENSFNCEDDGSKFKEKNEKKSLQQRRGNFKKRE